MKKFLLILVLLSQFVFAQQERKTLFGIIYNTNGVLENAHIVNFSTNQATFSNKEGEYRIFAKPNDSIRFTSIGYKTIFETLTEKDFNVYRKRVTLDKQDYKLDEVLLRNNELSGELAKDLKKVKNDLKKEHLVSATNFVKIDLKESSSNDHINTHIKPNIVRVDPTTDFQGMGTTTIIPFKESERARVLHKELAFKKSFPAKLMNELGQDFFFKELKIPVEKYHHFLEYCNPLQIEKYYQNNEVFKVIKILRKEHINYLKLLGKE